MPYKEKEIEKIYYTIGEIAKMFDVNTSHIRFWSKEFDVIRPATNKKGNRMYTIDDIENFKKIYELVKVKGFTLKGAKTQLKAFKSVPDETFLKDEMTDISSLSADGDEIFSGENKTITGFQSASSFSTTMDNPVAEVEALKFPGEVGLVDQIALLNSFDKIKSGLLTLKYELEQIEKHW